MHDDAPAVGHRSGLRSPLLATVLGLTAYLAVSGVWILLDPRSEAGRIQGLAHAAAGYVALLPWACHQVPHVLRNGRRPLSLPLVLGWAAGLALMAAMASGAWILALAVSGAATGGSGPLVHRAAGLAASALVLAHGVGRLRKPRAGL